MSSYKNCLSPLKIKECLPSNTTLIDNVRLSREAITNILNATDDRLLMIMGPCSFHDFDAALCYAKKLNVLANLVKDKVLIMMRVYLEKPRTNTGWKGYLNDPELNDTFCVEKGIYKARQFMLDLCEMKLPIATEILNPYAYMYFDDLLSWAAIGARTSESQPHREVASGLAIPIGFKNAMSGNLESAISGIAFASRSHVLLGINPEGNISLVKTAGNPHGHLILRGGKNGTNFQSENILQAEELMDKYNITKNIIVDCSHGNSSKNPNNQKIVMDNIILQINSGNKSIKGVMVESFLEHGNQPLNAQPENLKYGLSITDACIDWNTTELLVTDVYQNLLFNKAQNSRFINTETSLYYDNFPMAF